MSYSREAPRVPGSLNDSPIVSKDIREGQDGNGFMNRLHILKSTTPKGAPYLGLSARLSQIWFNRWTVLLLLVLVRVLILLASLNDNLGEARTKALSACTKVEDIGSAMASMPHYLSVGVNKLTAGGITEAVHGMKTMLDMTLDVVSALILFVINMMTSTYTCLITLAIHGSLGVAQDVVGKTTDAMNSAIGGIGDDIGKVISGAQSAIDDAFNAIQDAAGLFGGKIDKPTIDVSGDLDKLKNVKIDSSGFVSDIGALNSSLPTFEQVQNLTAQAVSFPFNLVKEALNESYGNWKFDESVFPVANKEALSFCSDNSVITDFFEHLFQLAHTAKIIAIVALSLLAIIALAVMAWWEIMRYRRQQERIRWAEEHHTDKTDFVYMTSRPISASVGVWFADKLRATSPKRRALARWSVAYATSLPALFVLSLAIAGLISCLCQFIILRAVESKVPELADEVGDFAGQVVNTLEGVSQKWATDANGVITSFNNDINDDVLRYVTNATSAVNDTLNTFTDEMEKGLNLVFGNTILKDPIQDVVRCLIGLKVESVQKGLTWVHDHANVDFPRFDNDTFSLGAQKSISGDSDLTSFLASPSSVTTDEVTGAVKHVTDFLYRGLVQEALISTALLLVYIIVVLGGVIRMLVSMTGSSTSYSGDGRDAAAMRENRSRSLNNSPEFNNGAFENEKVSGKVPAYQPRQHHIGEHARSSSYVSYGDSKR